MLFKWLKNLAEKRRSAEKIYQRASAQARHPYFYQSNQVPKSFAGHYELLCIHVYLVLERLRDQKPYRHLSQQITDHLIKDLELALTSEPLQTQTDPNSIKKLIAGFYQRAQAYKLAIHHNDRLQLARALNEYVYASNFAFDERSTQLAIYIQAAHAHLKTVSMDDIKAANFTFLNPQM